MFYVYILKLSTGDLYTGATSDLRRRLREHHAGRVSSTRHSRDSSELIHYEAYLLKSDALRREKYLKTTEGKRMLRQQIRDLLVQFRQGSDPGGIA